MLGALILTILIISFFTRLALMFISLGHSSYSLPELIRIFLFGYLFDVITAVYAVLVYTLYLTLVPKKWQGSLVDKIITGLLITVTLLIVVFAAFAEFPFWDEFESRFNFIAVDYLIYTLSLIHIS